MVAREMERPVAEDEQCFIDFKANNFIQGTSMKIHTNPRMINSILTGIEQSTPILIRTNFRKTTNIGPV